MQKSSEKQVAGMAAASELLDAQIIKVKVGRLEYAV